MSAATAGTRGSARAAPPPDDGLARLTDAEFRRIAALVRSLAGIVLPPRKKPLVASRLGKRLRALGCDGFAAYVALVESEDAADERVEFVNALTTNLTSFFREAHHFEDLARRLTADRNAVRLRLWSAACSTGEEAYSIAMTALEAGAATSGADLRILATDLDTNALRMARDGLFTAEKMEDCPKHLARRHFTREPDGRCRVDDQVRAMITFNRLNLHGDWPVRGPFDAIFCRNVLIYFGADEKRNIVDRFVRLLRPGGALYLGHSEAMLGAHPGLVSEGATIFTRTT